MDAEDPDNYPHHTRNLITSLLSHFGHVLKISSESVHNFSNNLPNSKEFRDPEDPDGHPDHYSLLAFTILDIS